MIAPAIITVGLIHAETRDGRASSHPRHSPHQTPAAGERQVLRLRQSPAGPGSYRLPAGHACLDRHKILTRHQMCRLNHLDRATGTPIRRLVHVDVKKLGNIPDGGGWRVQGRPVDNRHSMRHPATERTRHRHPVLGYSYLHTAIDDHSRLAYTEILSDETRETPSHSGTGRRPSSPPSESPSAE